MTRRLGVVSVGRSDYGLYRPILQALDRPGVESTVLAAGSHLSAAHGSTIEEIERDGWRVERVGEPARGDDPCAVAAAIGAHTAAFADALDRLRPDLLLVLGDRYEMLAAAAAALPFVVPVAHVHGGELTEGAFDDAIRHALTKLSHLHFAATAESGRRILQLGEESWRVHVVGAPGLDAVADAAGVADAELEAALGRPLGLRTLVVTYHPVTLEPARVEERVVALLDALGGVDADLVLTAPNADTHNGTVLRALQAFVAAHPRAVLVESLGSRLYLGLLARAAAMVGNSSSGILEAASFELPVVNVGERQRGRTRAANVIDVDDDAAAIGAAIERATSPDFRAGLAGLVNPYGDGRAAPRIAERLATVELDERLVAKRFVDLDCAWPA